MSYQFYPRKDDPCPNVGRCPHVGGAVIASLVLIGNENRLAILVDFDQCQRSTIGILTYPHRVDARIVAAP